MNYFVILKLLGLFTVCFAQDPVSVSVYYESKCPDSMKFISTQLWPAYQQVSSIMTVEFVPFGFETVTVNGSSWDFSCQHGPEECVGNLIHSCALRYYPDNKDNVPFISCSMSAPDPPAACQQCAVQFNLDWDLINNCASGEEGPQLLYNNGQITNSLVPEVTYVPWIIINGVYTTENEVATQIDLLKVICNAYTGTLPPQCEGL